MSENNREIRGLVYDPEDVPEGLNDEEQIRYWETHDVTEEYLAKVEEAPEDERPRPRTRPINVRFDDHTLGRLRDLADRRDVGYQTLLKQFVTERLYEEEKREGVLSATSTARVEEMRLQSVPSEKHRTGKPRDWQKEAYAFVDENKELLEDPDIDAITLSRLAKNSTDRLLELSGEIKKSSARAGFPATQLRRMKKGYDKLLEISEKALALYEEKFGKDENEGGQPGDSEGADYRSVIEEAERILQES